MLTTPARRCLVPVTSFSEYGLAPGEDGKKPLHWFDVPSRPIFAFAGIWRPTERGNAYGFLTTEPNAIVAPIHPKAMPVMLHDGDYDRWLTSDWTDARELVAPFPSQLMHVGT
jgi:putative SOS response-associated peptidase YedK